MKYLKFKEKKGLNNKIISLISSSNIDKDSKVKLINDLSACGESLYFQKCVNCGTVYFSGFWSCKNRFCAICSYKLHLARTAMVFNVLSFLDLYYLSHAVFTIRSQDNLRNMVRDIKAFIKSFDKDKRFINFKKKYLLGMVRNIEIKHGRKGWHVHLHTLVVANDSVDYFDIFRDVWKRVTKDEGSIFIRHVRNELNSVLECTKYNMKVLTNSVIQANNELVSLQNMGFHLYDDDYIAEMYYALKNERLFSKTGVFRGVDEMQFFEDSAIRECKKCGGAEFELIIEKYKDVFDFEVVDF